MGPWWCNRAQPSVVKCCRRRTLSRVIIVSRFRAQGVKEILTSKRLVEFLVDVVRPFGNELSRSAGKKEITGTAISSLVMLNQVRQRRRVGRRAAVWGLEPGERLSTP
jgi:hypothetical protein